MVRLKRGRLKGIAGRNALHPAVRLTYGGTMKVVYNIIIKMGGGRHWRW
jgi:hypothetical protein